MREVRFTTSAAKKRQLDSSAEAEPVPVADHMTAVSYRTHSFVQKAQDAIC